MISKMKERFRKLTRVVLPFITALILASQLTGCGASPKEPPAEEPQSGEEVALERVKSRAPADDEPEIESTDAGAKEPDTADAGMTDEELDFYFQLSFDSCLTFEENTYEEQMKLEMQTLQDYCSLEAKQLPDDYASRYESWRAQQSDSRYPADAPSGGESQQQPVSAPSGGGFQQSAPSGDTQQSGHPNGIGLDFGPIEIYHPNEGKSQEQLEKEWAEIDEANKDVHFQ